MDSMESVLTGPLLYLLIAWSVATIIFICWSSGEACSPATKDDQIFLDSAQEHMARNSAN